MARPSLSAPLLVLALPQPRQLILPYTVNTGHRRGREVASAANLASRVRAGVGTSLPVANGIRPSLSGRSLPSQAVDGPSLPGKASPAKQVAIGRSLVDGRANPERRMVVTGMGDVRSHLNISGAVRQRVARSLVGSLMSGGHQPTTRGGRRWSRQRQVPLRRRLHPLGWTVEVGSMSLMHGRVPNLTRSHQSGTGRLLANLVTSPIGSLVSWITYFICVRDFCSDTSYSLLI